MKKYYIVQELGSEYNDEIYVIDGGGKPVSVFQDLEAAQLRCEELEAKKLSDDIRKYGYSIEEVINDLDGFVEKFNEVFNRRLTVKKLEDDYEFALPEMTVKQYREIKDFLSIHFYEVVECNGE